MHALFMLLAALMAGCAPSNAGPLLATPPPLGEVAPVAASGGPERVVTVVAPDRSVLAAGPTLAVDALAPSSLSPWGLPLRGARPRARVVAGGFGGEAAARIRAPDGDSVLVAWVDLNGSGQLDVGDLVSDAAPVAPSVTLHLSHTWVTRLGSLPPESLSLRASLPPGEPDAHGRILLLGWDEVRPDGGVPRSPPELSWRTESRRRTWPETLDLQVVGLTDLHVLAVFDRDGDDRPSPGDLLAPPLPPSSWREGSAAVVFSRPMGGGR